MSVLPSELSGTLCQEPQVWKAHNEQEDGLLSNLQHLSSFHHVPYCSLLLTFLALYATAGTMLEVR